MCVCWSSTAPVSHRPLSSFMSKFPHVTTAAPKAPASPLPGLQPRALLLNTRPGTTHSQALCGALRCSYFRNIRENINDLCKWCRLGSASVRQASNVNLNIIHCDSAVYWTPHEGAWAEKYCTFNTTENYIHGVKTVKPALIKRQLVYVLLL